MNLPAAIFACIILCCCANGHAGEMKAECPASLAPEMVKPGKLVPGWVTTPQQMHLNSAGMLSGEPDTGLYVMPDGGTKNRAIYTFDKGHGQRWLWCGYGGIELSRRLDDRATRCIVTYSMQRRDGAPTLTAVAQCR